MTDLKNKLHELIDSTSDNVLLENIYLALRQRIEPGQRDILDDLSPEQFGLLQESIAQYKRGETKTHEEVLQLLRQWNTK
jgi:hypothetical protein